MWTLTTGQIKLPFQEEDQGQMSLSRDLNPEWLLKAHQAIHLSLVCPLDLFAFGQCLLRVCLQVYNVTCSFCSARKLNQIKHCRLRQGQCRGVPVSFVTWLPHVKWAGKAAVMRWQRRTRARREMDCSQRQIWLLITGEPACVWADTPMCS